LEGVLNSEHVRQFRKEKREIPLEASWRFLHNDQELFRCLLTKSFQRSLPKPEILQSRPDVAQLLRKVLLNGSVSGELKKEPALEFCYKMGWLQAELVLQEGVDLGPLTVEFLPKRTVYIFPTRMHQRYLEYLLRVTAPEAPLNRYDSLESLCIAVIRKFSRLALQSAGPGIDAGGLRPVEAQYGDEFYRGCFDLLGHIYLTSEWAGESLGGRVDFQVKLKRWAIECVRDGDKLPAHIARFEEKGLYHKWILSGEIKKYIILDFRKTMPQKPRGDVPLFSIVFSEDFSTYNIFDARLNQVGETVALLK